MGTPYQDILLDHFRNPRHQTKTDAPPDCELRNPLCGDLVRLWGRKEGEQIHVEFAAEGCAICMAAASIMCESVNGASPQVARALAQRVQAAFADGDPVTDSDALAALCDVRNFPMRTRCATLPWSALETVAKAAEW